MDTITSPICPCRPRVLLGGGSRLGNENRIARINLGPPTLARSQPNGSSYEKHEPHENNGDRVFNRRFNFLFRSTNDRLRRFDSTDACGRWNATLVDDFRSDSEFIRTADELFFDVTNQVTPGERIASDGLLLESVVIDIGNSIDLFFRLNFLIAPNGNGVAPAKFSFAADTAHDGCRVATLACGLREPDGRFWFPRSTRALNIVLPDDYAWAYSRTRAYDPPTIASWTDRQNQRREDH